MTVPAIYDPNDGWTPTYEDRQTYGRQLTPVQVAERCFLGGLGDWRGIRVVATLMGENGLLEWARPMVWSPGKASHLSVDRGAAAWNSYWHPSVPDAVAFDPYAAIDAMIAYVSRHEGYEIDLSEWHGSDGPRFYENLPGARAAMNEVRSAQDPPLDPI